MSSVSDAAGCYLSVGPGLYEDVTTLASAAFFLSDGKTVIHPISYGYCTNLNGATGIARYDLTTNQEQIVTLEAGSELTKFGPLGDVVYSSVAQGSQLITWQSAGPRHHWIRSKTSCSRPANDICCRSGRTASRCGTWRRA